MTPDMAPSPLHDRRGSCDRLAGSHCRRVVRNRLGFRLEIFRGLTRFWPSLATALAILASFALMSFALRSLPFGTAYAIWTGIGAAGSIILGMVIFSEPTDPIRIICLTLILAGVVGLKLTSPV